MTLRRFAFGLALLLAAVACLNDTLHPSRTDVQVNLQASVAGLDQPATVEVRVFYRRASNDLVRLPVTPEAISVTPGQPSQTVPITVELTPCLQDDAARVGGQPGCLLAVELRLLDATSTLLDRQTQTLEFPVLPNSSVELPEFTLTRPLLTVTGEGAGTGSGTVTAEAVGGQPALSCSIIDGTAAAGGCAQPYPYGTVVSLTAPGGEFSGACAGPEACTVTLDGSQQVRVRFALAPPVGTLEVQVTGLPEDVDADIEISGPGGFSRPLKGQEELRDLPTGNYIITARPVTSQGLTYSPDPTSQTVVVSAGERITATVAYNAPTTGSLVVTIEGLPPAASASVTVRGPNGFQRRLTGSTPLGDLSPGEYTLIAASREIDGQPYDPTPPSQTVNVSRGRTAEARVVYTVPPATQLVFLRQPVTVEAGATMAEVRVAAQDAQGRTATTYAGPIGLALGGNPGGAELTGGAAVTPVRGVARFSGIRVSRPGTSLALIASSGSLPDKASRSFAVTVSTTLSTIEAVPNPIEAGGDPTRITVMARDAQGNPLSGLPVTLSYIPSGTATLIQPSEPTDANGQATGELSSTIVGRKIVSASINGTPIVQTAAVEVISPQVTLRIVSAGDGTGTVTSKDGSIACEVLGKGAMDGSCSSGFRAGTGVNLTAEADEGSSSDFPIFLGWGGEGIDCGTLATCQLTMTQDTTVVVNFRRVVSLDVGGDGDGDGDGAVTGPAGEFGTVIDCAIQDGGVNESNCFAYYLSGTTVTLTASWNPAFFTFAGWSGEGIDCGFATSCVVQMNSPRIVRAAFEPFVVGLRVRTPGPNNGYVQRDP